MKNGGSIRWRARQHRGIARVYAARGAVFALKSVRVLRTAAVVRKGVKAAALRQQRMTK